MINRKGDWMQTFTGRQFFPIDPRIEEVDIIDIAHALSNQCRFAGHCESFYSVAEHSCYVSDILSDDLQLAGLLHDASEAYLMDLIRPLKRCAGFADQYISIESQLMTAIAVKYGFQYPLHADIQLADNTILMVEKTQILKPSPAEWRKEDLSDEVCDIEIENWPPNRAKNEFLWRFYNLR